MRTKKTVFKSFSYLQCDDFAAYLMDMARKGWHFKQWRAGLVFEKGEPADTVYAVEVFIDGSVFDTKPEVHTLEFADYCQAAGWELADAKQKFCIFRKVRPDAVDILTPEERLKNIAKEEQKQDLYYLFTGTVFMGLQLWRYTGRGFVSNVFSNLQLFISMFWALLWLGAIVRFVHFLLWKRASRKKLEEGKPLYFGKKGSSFNALSSWASWVCVPLLVILPLLVLSEGKLWMFVLVVITSAVPLLTGFLISRFRPDAETNQIIQLAIPMVSMLLIIILVVIIFASDTTIPTYEGNAPLVYEELGIDAGAVRNADVLSSHSILGSSLHGYLTFEDAQMHMHYYVYRSKHRWILDKIWNDDPYLQTGTDVSELWGAETATLSGKTLYTVRYEDAVILLYVSTDTPLTQQQIDVARAALYESR